MPGRESIGDEPFGVLGFGRRRFVGGGDAGVYDSDVYAYYIVYMIIIYIYIH